MKKAFSIVFFHLLFIVSAFTQTIETIGLSHHSVTFDRGFIIPHHEDMYHLYKPVHSLQYQYLLPINNSSTRLGALLYGADLGSSILGKGYALGLNMEKYWRPTKKNELSIGFAMGLGIVTNPYDVKTNDQNRAIGSMGNAFGQLYVIGSHTVSKSLCINLGLRFSHFSNGAWKAPNLGINIPSVSIGMSKKIRVPPIEQSELKREYWCPFTSLRLGRKSLDIDDSRAFWVPVIELGAARSISKTANLRMAIATHADPFYRFEKFETMKPFSISKGIDIGLSVGYHQYFGKWGMLFDLGWYLYKPNPGYKTPYFEALGITYYCNSNIMAMARLKANKTTADLIEWGFVYSFN